MDWLTSLFETLNALATDQGAWLYLSMIPVVFGMAQTDEGVEEQTDEDLGADLDDDNIDDDSQQDQGDEPFLKAGESVYKTREEAERGYAEKDRYIGEYKQYGTPAEVAALRERAQLFDKFKDSLDGGTKAEQKKAWDDLDPETKAKFEGFDKTYGKELDNRFLSKQEMEKMGLVRREDLRSEFDNFRKEERARESGSKYLEERGLGSNPLVLDIINNTVAALATHNPALHEQIVGKYRSGDVDGAIKAALDVVYGPAKKGKPNGGAGSNGKVRDASGRFVDRAEQDRAKRTAGRLPDAPPNGNARRAEGQEKPAFTDRRERRAAVLEQLRARQKARGE